MTRARWLALIGGILLLVGLMCSLGSAYYQVRAMGDARMGWAVLGSEKGSPAWQEKAHHVTRSDWFFGAGLVLTAAGVILQTWSAILPPAAAPVPAGAPIPPGPVAAPVVQGTTNLDEATRLDRLEKNARSYASGLRDAQPLASASQAHADQMLTWSIGLMGAGLFALPTVLKSACQVDPQRALVSLATPWVVGILVALSGRLVGGLRRDTDDLLFLGKWQIVEAMLLRGLNANELGRQLLAVMRDEDPKIAKRVRRLKRLDKLAEVLYWLTHVAVGAGIVTIFWRLARC